MNPQLGLALCVLSGLFFGTYVRVTHDVGRTWASLWPAFPANGSAFDFIVVGSGSAGSVVAARLAEARYKVLLVEAGGPSHWLQGIPNFAPVFLNSDYDWSFKTEPQKHMAKAHKDRRQWVNRGKSLGGSSMLNFNNYMRGQSGDYDEWAALGNAGWAYEDVLPFFKSSENYSGSVGSSAYHGSGGGGRQSNQETPHTHPVNDVLERAFEEMGFPRGVDVNAPPGESYGITRSQVCLRHGWRLGTYRSFAEPLADQGFLYVLPYTTVNKILLDKSGRAVGVRADRFGEELVFTADKEVVLSAGAIASPQLLMVSGIGPKQHLESLGIDVAVDLPAVGQNLQDHLLLTMFFYNKQSGFTFSPFYNLNPFNYLRLWLNGDGPLSDNGAGTTGFFRTEKADPKDKRPDVQILDLAFGFNVDYGLGMRHAFNLRDESYASMFEGHETDSVFMVSPTLARPKSRGTLRLASADVNDAPIIDPNYLSNKDDVETLKAAYKHVMKLKDTKAFKEAGISAFAPDKFHCGELASQPDSDAYAECYVRTWAVTVYHHSGTCAMGRVVDEQLRVRGVAGLRVADASVMPRLVSANTHAPTVMIGEKAASLIVDAWKRDDDGGRKNDKRQQRKKEEL